MSGEIWHPVPISDFASSYEVSNTGKLRSIDRGTRTKGGAIQQRRGRELKLLTNKKGYTYVYLRASPLYKNVTVHRLMALAFIPNPSNLPEVNHIDTIKSNCSEGNLEWIGRLGNHSHAVKSGIKMACVRKLSDDEVAAIIARHQAGECQPNLATEYNVNQSTISRLVNQLRRANG